MRKRIRGLVKAATEKLSGNRVWLEPSSDLSAVRSLITKLAPVSVSRPLIRIGGDEDGGYLLPDDLEGINVVVSPGVSTEIGFDLSMAERGMDIYMVDASVVGPPVPNPRFHFQKKFLDIFEDDQNTRLDSLCASIVSENSGDRLLQMDIEGAEYQVLLDASDETISSFRIMLIEFHGLDRMFGNFPFQMIRATFQKLLRTHEVVHIHPNNYCQTRVRGDIEIPPVMEFTFYRKDRALPSKPEKLTFPHPLDRDNVQHLPSVILPTCWQ